MPPGFVKFDIAKNSTRSFCIGVPDRSTRFRHASDANAWDVWASSFFKRCASSQTIMSALSFFLANRWCWALNVSYDITSTS